MAILHSCCFWKSVRKGSYASAVYAMIYFGSTGAIVSIFLHGEQKYLSGEVGQPSGESFLEKDAISSTTVIFNILLLVCCMCGVITSLFVIIGLRCDQRELLIPWIAVMTADLLVEWSHFVYLVILETLDFEPLTATLFTIDFFIMCLNVYCLLCVISQYQEYRAGRGFARQPKSGARYIPPPASTTTCLNTFRQSKTVTSPLVCPQTNFTIIPEETQMNGNLTGATNKSSNPPPAYIQQSVNSLKKKRVQFPDDHSPESLSTDSTKKVLLDPNKNGQPMIDTPPEYKENLKSWQE
ncbi:unnamed protein product [Hermetia illucens]|uniref:Uncharacterized protein n=1 Tax=Hermetia illucens TaxID=343691 RepID=A0A7R8ULG8_HERIL|nr:uncharacterized protein LOC119648958 [Hermetia illucens]CAD7083053.1 unnamed protein product [Hermetia illucens]